MQDSLQPRCLDISTRDNLSTAITKWVATARRLINTVLFQCHVGHCISITFRSSEFIQENILDCVCHCFLDCCNYKTHICMKQVYLFPSVLIRMYHKNIPLRYIM